MEIKRYTPKTIYEEFKEQIEKKRETAEDDIRCYWGDDDPKYINAVSKAEGRLYQLKLIEAFIEEHKAELDKY